MNVARRPRSDQRHRCRTTLLANYFHGPERERYFGRPSGHVGFGMGLHQCVGQHVARLEAEAPLTALATRVGRLEITGPTWRHHDSTLRAWDSLPVRVRQA